MKKLKLLFLLFALTLIGFNAQAQQGKKEQTLAIKTSAVCGMCKASIEKAMANEKGIKSSSLDVESKALTVVFDTRKTDASKIKQAVAATGYDADDLPAQKEAYHKLNSCCRKQ